MLIVTQHSFPLVQQERDANLNRTLPNAFHIWQKLPLILLLLSVNKSF